MGVHKILTKQISHKQKDLNLYLEAIIILLNQKGIKISEDEIEEVIDSIKVMDKLMN